MDFNGLDLPIKIEHRGFFAVQKGINNSGWSLADFFSGLILLVGIFVWTFVDIANFVIPIPYRTQFNSDPLTSLRIDMPMNQDPSREQLRGPTLTGLGQLVCSTQTKVVIPS